jgi:hypothetical protein
MQRVLDLPGPLRDPDVVGLADLLEAHVPEDN